MHEPGNEAWLYGVHTFVFAGAGQGTTEARQDDTEETGGQFADHQMSSGCDTWDMSKQVTIKQPGYVVFSFIAFMYMCALCLQLFILATLVQRMLKRTTVFFCMKMIVLMMLSWECDLQRHCGNAVTTTTAPQEQNGQ